MIFCLVFFHSKLIPVRFYYLSLGYWNLVHVCKAGKESHFVHVFFSILATVFKSINIKSINVF